VADRGSDFHFLDRLDELVEELHQNVPKALKDWDADAIHDARVATRRLKAAIDLMQFVLSDHHRKPFGKALRKLRKRLGPLRDLDVMIENLAPLTSHRTHRPAAAWLRDHLIHRRDEAHDESRQGASAAAMLAKLATWADVRDEVIEAREAIDSLLAESLHLQLDAFAERADAVVGTTGNDSNERQDPSTRSARLSSPKSGQDPHQLRIAGKLLRYTLELAQAQGHKLPASVMRSFKKMQERLGDWHDDVVLIECTMETSLDESVAYHDAPLQQGLLALGQLFVKRATRELAGFSDLWKQRGSEVAHMIRERFPLTRPVSEPQTGPGPSGSSDIPAPVALPPDVASTA
jgi:CHAD domain-containing protein